MDDETEIDRSDSRDVNSSGCGDARRTVQMANIRCDQYLAMPPSDLAKFSAWMSGWFSYQTRTPWVDLLAYRQNIANVKAWCQRYPNEKVMSGLKEATGTK